MKNVFLLSLMLLGISATACAMPFSKGEAGAGKKIVEQHKCNDCHAGILGGDGSAMFTRTDRKIKKPAALAAQITRCSNSNGLMLFEDDEENIGAYLNKNYYKFK
jgi:hypothetical protein